MNKKLAKIRHNYLKIEPPEDLKNYGWQALKEQIEEQEKRKFLFLPIFSRSLIFLSIAFFVLIVTVGFAYASWKAAPGDTLYPIKQLSERVISSLGKNNKIDIKNKHDVLKTSSPKPKNSVKAASEKEVKKTNQTGKTKDAKLEERIKIIKLPDDILKKKDSGNQSPEIIQAVSNIKKDINQEVKGLENKKQDIKTENKLNLP